MNVLEITAPTIEWALLAPLLVVFGGAVLAVVVEAFTPRGVRYVLQTSLSALAILGAGAALAVNLADFEPQKLAMDTLSYDGPTLIFWVLLLIFGLGGVALFAERGVSDGQSAFAASAAAAPGSPLEREAVRLRREHTEVFPLLLFALLGMMLFSAANDLILMFVALEVFSLPLYLLSSMARRRRLLSQESGLKYFLLGSLASGFFLYGVAMLFGYSGSLKLTGLAETVSAETGNYWLLLLGLVLISVGLLFKIGAAPFHSWTPDVYMGAPTPVTGFMAIATKSAAVAALMRVLYVGLGAARWDWQPIIAVVAVLSMLVGAVIALWQTDLKRLLAYSAITHAGFILVGVVGAVVKGTDVLVTSVGAVAFYLLTYGVATLGAFGLVMTVRRAGGEATAIDDWKGIGKSNPVMATVMTLFFLSFAGIPLTAGFVGKLAVFGAAFQGGYAWLVIVAIIMSVVAAFFYLKVTVAMWFQEADEDAEITVATPSLWVWTLVVIAALATLVLGLLPGGVLDLFGQFSEFIR
ncbi:MAG: NADH-quinone oxidoreductase subunit NuoN [Propionibacteriaceae bacterium]|nr:NADH-quinone oxidoreductase subunit NuoN [Propionibacteriaceae bacterium]